MQYTFAVRPAWRPAAPHADGTCGRHARELHLTEVRDPHGNAITITYNAETETVTCNNTTSYERAIRPARRIRPQRAAGLGARALATSPMSRTATIGPRRARSRSTPSIA